MTDADIQIREANADDDALLGELNSTVQALHHQEDPDSYKEPDVAASRSWFGELLKNPKAHLFVAETTEGHAVGYALAIEVEKPDNPFKHRVRLLELDQIGVTDEFQSRGVGYALYARVLRKACDLEVSYISLTVMDFNRTAVQFYRRQGFTDSSHRLTLRVH